KPQGVRARRGSRKVLRLRLAQHRREPIDWPRRAEEGRRVRRDQAAAKRPDVERADGGGAPGYRAPGVPPGRQIRQPASQNRVGGPAERAAAPPQEAGERADVAPESAAVVLEAPPPQMQL